MRLVMLTFAVLVACGAAISRGGTGSDAADSRRQDDRCAADRRGRVQGRAIRRRLRTVRAAAAQPGGDESRARDGRLPALQEHAAAAAQRVRDHHDGAPMDAAVRVERPSAARPQGRPQPRHRQGDRRGPQARAHGRGRGRALHAGRRAAAQSERERRHVRAGGREARRAGRDRRDRHHGVLHVAGDGPEHGADAVPRWNQAGARAVSADEGGSTRRMETPNSIAGRRCRSPNGRIPAPRCTCGRKSSARSASRSRRRSTTGGTSRSTSRRAA